MRIRKNSRQRTALLENLTHRYDHPTADMLYHDLRKTFPRMSLGTVYRNLSLLVSDGEVKKLSLGDGIERYDGQTEDHGHFTCTCCGRIIDFPISAARLLRTVSRQNEIGCIDSHSVMLYGRCSDCLKK